MSPPEAVAALDAGGWWVHDTELASGRIGRCEVDAAHQRSAGNPSAGSHEPAAALARGSRRRSAADPREPDTSNALLPAAGASAVALPA
jgi:hypothetical protein